MAYITNTLFKLLRNHIRTNIYPAVYTSTDSYIQGSKDIVPSHGSKDQDILLNDIKNVNSTGDLLKIVSSHHRILNQNHTIHTLRSLFDFAKRDPSNASSIIHHPSFDQLCSRLKKHSRTMDMNDIIDILKILSYLTVPGNSTIFQYLLQMIRQNINDLSLSQIMFLDFVLHKTQQTHMTDALMLALPLVFQLQLAIQMDHENLPHLVDLLSYSSKNNVPEKYIQNIVTCLLLHSEKTDINSAKYIVAALCKIRISWNDNHNMFKKLLNNCLNLMAENINQMQYYDVIRILNLMKDNLLFKKDCFYHEKFFNSCSFFAIEQNITFEQGIQISKILSRMGHTHIQLLDYLTELIIIEPSILIDASPFNIFNYVHSMSNANYKPHNWDIIKQLILRNPINWNKKTGMPWTKFATELASLDCYSDSILNKVFSKEFLEDYLAREDNVLDYLQLLTLYQAVLAFNKNYDGTLPPEYIINKAINISAMRYPDPVVKAALELALGGPQYVASRVVMPNGLYVDHVICYRDGNYPIALSNNAKNEEIIKFQDLKIELNRNVVCILNFTKICYSANQNRLKGNFDVVTRILSAMGCNVIPLSVPNWMSMPAAERIPYLMREINVMVEENKNVGIENELS